MIGINEREKIKNKIKNLLELAKKSEYDNEMNIALLKARKLIAKYEIKEKELKRIKKNSFVARKTLKHNFYTRWMFDLGVLIIENHRCDFLIGSYNKKINFDIYGYEEDIKIVETILDTLIIFIKKRASKVYYKVKKDKRRSGKGVKASYSLGFVKGLEENYCNQNYESQEMSLVMVVPQEVKKEKEKNQDGDTFDMSKINENNIFYSKGYEQGVEDGRNFGGIINN